MIDGRTINDHERPLLCVENLKVYFQSNGARAHAVDGISFEVREKETVCIVGESGCGKTVSALSILGLIPTPPGEIVDGQIIFSGQNLIKLDEKAMQKIRGNHISMVFQEPLTSLNPVFTIGDQIGEAVHTHKQIEQRHFFNIVFNSLTTWVFHPRNNDLMTIRTSSAADKDSGS